MDLASFSSSLVRLIQVHGPWIISVVVALESAGMPLPGETILIAAALLAAATNQIDIAVVVTVAAEVRSSETGSDTRSGEASEYHFFENTGGTFVSMKIDC
jgi:hypothetical protein